MSLKRVLNDSIDETTISNELNYDFQIKSNIIKKTPKNPIHTKFNTNPEKEYLRSKIFNELHTNYDRKCKELFYFKFTPKDSLNRFLLEQLSLDNVDSRHLISKPENIFKLDTLEKEIKTVLCLTTDLKSIQKSRFKLIRTIKDCVIFAKNSIGNDEYYRIFKNENLSRLAYDDELTDDELLCEFKDKRKFYYEKLKAHIESKLRQIKNYMFNELDRTSVELKSLSKIDENHESVLVEHLSNDFVLVKYKDTNFKISEFHFDKLEDLFEKSRGIGFNDALYCLVARYQTFFKNNEVINEGYGMQAALPITAFEQLNKLFDVTHELFASPLNCYFSNFCSAFYDIDYVFGSSGSFFNFQPIEGSFECNPPFTEEVIERMADRIDYLLTKSKLPLSFIVFIPEWLDPPTPGLVKMNKSKYLSKKFNVENGEHKFLSGSQYLNNKSVSNLYDAVHNTRVFILQNDAGYKKWKPTDDKIELLKISMNNNVKHLSIEKSVHKRIKFV